MKTGLWILALALASPGKAERMLKEAKITLPEAIGKAGEDFKVASSRLAEEKGRLVFVVKGLGGGAGQAVSVDAKSAEVIDRKAVTVENGGKIAAAKTSTPRAIEIALARVAGKAVKTEVELEDGRLVIEVYVFHDGKLWEIEVDAESGEVLEVEEEDDEQDDG